MKWFQAKIHAFTLAELLVVLAISAVVATLSFTVLSLISKNIHSIQGNYTNNTELHLLEQRLALDLYRFPTVRVNKQTGAIWFSSPVDSVQYKVDEHILIRDTDTLSQALHSIDYYFLGATTELGAVDAIKLSVSIADRQYPVFLYKTNDALTLLKDGN